MPQVKFKNGATLRRLFAVQPPYIINKGRRCKVHEMEVRRSLKSQLPGVVATVIDPETKGSEGHKCQIVVVGEAKESKGKVRVSHLNYVKVSCECEFFKFSCEYALHKNGLANIRYSNGEPAEFTNPGNYPILCKHLWALADRVIKRGL